MSGEKDYAAERALAIKAVVKASFLTVMVQKEMLTEDTITKKDKSPVTVADFGSQALILHELSSAFPEDQIIAEESGKVLQANPEACDKALSNVQVYHPDMTKEQMIKAIDRGANRTVSSKRWWTLDPVDGTLGFLRREQYAVCLALMVDNKPVVAVLGCPALPHDLTQPDGPSGVLLVAVKGRGAFWRPLWDDSAPEQPIVTSPNTDPTRAIMTESVEKSHTAHDVTGEVAKSLGVTVDPVRIDSQCKYAVVARGQSSVYLRLSSLSYKEKIWDHAAGVLIVQEAGGRVSDFTGGEIDFSKGHTLCDNVGIVCTSGPMYEPVMIAIKQTDPIGILKKQDEAKKTAADAAK